MNAIVENIIFKYQTQVLCVGIYLSNRYEWQISLIHARIHKNEINLVSTLENLKDLNEAGDMLRHDLPVVLHLDGWGVLIKDNITENNSIPIDNNEFFLKGYLKPDGGGSYFSIIRTDLLNTILEVCLSVGLNITGISFGPFNVGLLAPYLEQGKEIKVGKWKLTLSKGHINSLSAEGIENESIYDIGGDKISSALLPLYATVVSFFSGERGSNDLVTKSSDEFVYGKLVKYVSLFSLSLILLLLLLNFLIWDSLRNRNTELTFEVSRNEQLLTQLTKKEKELKEKENLVAQYIGTYARTHYSWYADQLSSILPSGIRLTLMDVQPLTKKQKPGVAITYKNKQIEVEGDATNLSEIGGWVKAIQTEKWVKHVELISFFTQNDQTTGHFKLQINY